MLFNNPTLGYRHQVAAWSSLRRPRGFRSLACWLEGRARRALRRASLKFRRLIGLPFVSDGERTHPVRAVRKTREQPNKLQYHARWSVKRR
jgi:hypothetical protein